MGWWVGGRGSVLVRGVEGWFGEKEGSEKVKGRRWNRICVGRVCRVGNVGGL